MLADFPCYVEPAQVSGNNWSTAAEVILSRTQLRHLAIAPGAHAVDFANCSAIFRKSESSFGLLVKAWSQRAPVFQWRGVEECLFTLPGLRLLESVGHIDQMENEYRKNHHLTCRIVTNKIQKPLVMSWSWESVLRPWPFAKSFTLFISFISGQRCHGRSSNATSGQWSMTLRPGRHGGSIFAPQHLWCWVFPASFFYFAVSHRKDAWQSDCSNALSHQVPCQ